MKKGQILLQFPLHLTEHGALAVCEAKGYKVIERKTTSVIGFNLMLQRGRTWATLIFDKAVNRWTLVEAIV